MFINFSVSNSQACWEIPVKFNRETDIQDILSTHWLCENRWQNRHQKIHACTYRKTTLL